MQRVQSCDHIFSNSYRIRLLIWIRHHGLILPISHISGHLHPATIPCEAIPQLAKSIALIADILRNLVIARREPYARIRKTAVPASIYIYAMPVSRFPEHTTFDARSKPLCRCAPYIRTRIVVLIPPAVKTSEARQTDIRAQLFRLIRRCKIGCSMMSHLAVICTDIVPDSLVRISPRQSRKRLPGIVLIPEICPEKIRDPLMFPGRIILIMQSSTDGPSLRQPVFSRSDGTGLSMSSHEIAEDIGRCHACRSIKRKI